MRKVLLSVILATVSGPTVRAAEDVTVGGITFPTTLKRKIGDKRAQLRMTGAGVLEKKTLKFCAVASYVDQEAKLDAATELAAADCPKVLHLVMLRNLNGRDLHETITDGIARSNPSLTVKKEMRQFANRFRTKNVRKGDHIWLTHDPEVGLRCKFGETAFVIRNLEFARAVWNNYFGPASRNEELKKSLVDRL